MDKHPTKFLNTNPTGALQYGTTDGMPQMKECAIKRAKKVNAYNEGDSVIITTGANQGIDLTAKALINKGDKIIVESPSFIGSLNAFRTYECELVGVKTDSYGMDMEDLEKALAENDGVKMIYTIPTFQNPTGTTMPLERRKKLIELANKYDVLVIIDDLIATGGTLEAIIKLVERLGGIVVKVCCLIDLPVANINVLPNEFLILSSLEILDV